MPNHINSQVEITGDKEKIQKLIKDLGIILDLEAEEQKFDFNAIVARPKELDKTTSPAKILPTQKEADEKNAEEESKGPFRTFYITQAQSDDYKKRFGADNWYDWSYDNWGTKWSAYEVKLIDWSDTKLVVDIQTAWDTPHKIWEALEAQGFTVKGVYYGEMEGYEYIGDGNEAFDAYVDVTVEYNNLEQGIQKEADITPAS